MCLLPPTLCLCGGNNRRITGVRSSLLYSRCGYITSGVVSDPNLVHRDLQMILCSIIIWNVRQNWTWYEIQVTQTGLTEYERNKREETHVGVQADRTRHKGMRTQYNIMKPHLLVLKVLSADCFFRDHISVVGASYPAFCDQLLLPLHREVSLHAHRPITISH